MILVGERSSDADATTIGVSKGSTQNATGKSERRIFAQRV
jgi:hypothetical protein